MTDRNINKLKEAYNKWWQKRESEWSDSEINIKTMNKNFSIFYDCLAPRDTGKLVDICCSNGTFLSYLERKTDLDLYGTDLADFAIEKAKKRLKRAQVQAGDAQNMDFYDDNSFDYVTCLGSLEHLPQPLAGAKEISRILKQTGKALILVPNLYFLGHIYMALRYGVYPSEGYQEFSEMFSTTKGWEDLLSEGGLKVIKTYKYNEMGKTKKVSGLTVGLWNIFKPLIPVGLSYCFIFICKKTQGTDEKTS
jgi:ubiquinone/menaquinone biosynthesis C-methylase UbiE